jgi:hypothetical protein
MSNINRMDRPTSVGIDAGFGGSGVGVDRMLTPSVAVGADIGADGRGGARAGLSATNYIFPDKAFSPFGSVRYNLGFGGPEGTSHSVGARAGAEYRFSSGFSAGAYVGFDRALGGRDSRPWGAEAGVGFAIHF